MPVEEFPKAILFDLDDTIIAHRAVEGDLWKTLCTGYSRLNGDIDADRLLEEVEQARNWYWDDTERHRRGRLQLFNARREIVERAFASLGIDDINAAHELADTYSTRREEMVKFFSGSVDTLDYLKSSRKKMALITNGASDMQRAKIERFGLAGYFDYILVEGEFGAGKPDKSVFTHTLGVLGASPEDAWMVGDDLNRDIAGAQSVGIHAVWVDWARKGLPETSPVSPDRIISAISELIK